MGQISTNLLSKIIKSYLGTNHPNEWQSLLMSEEWQSKKDNWKSLWQTASKHKLQLVLQKALKVSKTPLKPLMKRYQMTHSRRSLLKLRELQRVLATFEKANIRLTPYKGLAFAHCFYGDISMRTSVDMDLAIALSDIPASFAIMRSLGYIELSKEKDGVESNEQHLHKSRAYYIDYSWIFMEDEQIKFNVELHYQPSHPVLHVPLYFADIPSNAYTDIKIAGCEIKTFTKPYLALFTLIHHGLIDCWGQYRHLVDLAMMLKNLEEPEYKAFKELLAQHQIQQSFYVGLYILETLFDLPINDSVYQAKKYKKIGNQLIVALQENSLAGKWSENPKKLLYHLRMRDTFYQQLATGKNLLMFKARF